MSDSWIAWKPRMLEPSKPSPSSKMSSFNSSTGIVQCCQVPGRSTNLRSTILAPLSLASLSTSPAVFAIPFVPPDRGVRRQASGVRLLTTPSTAASPSHHLRRESPGRTPETLASYPRSSSDARRLTPGASSVHLEIPVPLPVGDVTAELGPLGQLGLG